ncbi:MAG: methylated-DNA--[protein]-cysteine S-methyltransferase [Bryobacteraceae bacterium]
MESPIGELLLAADEAGLRHILFADGREPAKPRPDWRPVGNDDATPLRETIGQLRAWFAGELREFDLPLAPEGSAFHQRVWRELLNIPYGETITYGELARRIGSPNASRAVGRANGANPIPIVIPCHRVIGSDGKLTGYGGGLPRKEFLLALERKQMPLPLAASAAAPTTSGA